MGSLKNIMNPDDDDRKNSQDIRTGTTSSSTLTPSPEQDSSMAMPTYAVHIDYSSGIHYPSRRHSPQYPLHTSFASSSSSSSSSASSPSPPSLFRRKFSPTGSRRRRNTSIESMESNFGHGQGQGHGSAYSAASIRPLPSGVTAGEQHPVKLTPITGRVSRAKKGVPVHTCEICRPAKTFTRAEHLRRHQLSHQPPDLACTVPGCDKVFHRKDLLERHQQRHEQDECLAKEAGHPSRRSFSTTSSSQGYATSPPMQSLQMQSPFRGQSGASFSSSSIPDLSMSPTHWQSTSTSTAGRSRRDHARDAQTTYHLDLKGEYVIDSVSGVEASNPRMIPGYDEPRTTMAMRSILSAVPDLGMSDSVSSSIPWAEGMPSSASESAYSTPPSDQHMPRRTPSMEWPGQMPSFAASSSSPVVPGAGFPLSFGYDTTPPQGYAALYGDAIGFALPGYEDRTPMYASHVLDSAMRSLSPQLLVGQSPDPLAAVTDRSMYARSLSREPVDALGLFMAQDVMSVDLSREIRSAIPAYLEVYWDKAHSMFPFIHRPSFEDASFTDPEHLDILQCAMTAVATQFLEHREHRDNGHQLHAFAWERSKMYTTSQDWPLPIMQAVLLCEYYARFRGRSKKAYQPSLRFETLYQMVINSMQASSFPLHLSACHSSQQWKYWVDLESRRRLLSACFLLDVHTMSYLEQPRVAVIGLDYDHPESLPIPLSLSTAHLWDARSPREWSTAITSHSHTAPLVPATVGSSLLSRLSPADVAAIPPFDAALLQAAHVLRLPAALDPVPDAARISLPDCALLALFPCSPSAMTYFALHHTPLHTLLAVAGDSWVFNKKILRAQDFAAHKARLRAWRDSGSAALAATAAARALALFLDGDAYTARGAPERKEISDFWAVYACALVCWAFAHGSSSTSRRGRSASNSSANTSMSASTSTSTSTGTRPAALRWIAEVAEMPPCAVQRMSERERADGSGAVGLARRYVEQECLGGRNMLLGDALGVLRKLEEGDGHTYF